MKILVTGAGGQLGYDVVNQLTLRGIDNLGIDIAQCDLVNREQVCDTFSAYMPDAVIHCAAYTAVDRAEQDAERCYEVNVVATQNVARQCAQMGAKLLYISTDYVFSGEGTVPFETGDLKAPLSVYGKTKYEGELAVMKATDRHFVVRISWAFGVNGQNFVRTMLRLGAEREHLTVVNDQVGSPTYTEDLAKLLCDMIVTDKYGVYHATNEGYCSWYEFAEAIMREAGLPCAIDPVSTAEYPTAARRPFNSRLSKKSLDDAGFSRLPSWQDALRAYVREVQA